jgi:tetratricopeptide (TPR) repeat protein
MKHATITTRHLAWLGLGLLISLPAAADLDQDLRKLQNNWEQVKYLAPANAQESGFQKLLVEADQFTARYPNRAEPLIWHAIVEASFAGAKGGLGALGHVKNAKKSLESAIKLDASALQGSAYTSLGSLYYQVPGWPIGFGDKQMAADYLKKALSLNPDGIDANYFYGELLYKNDELAEAEKHLRAALKAPARAGRELADAGRRKEVQALLDKIAQKR